MGLELFAAITWDEIDMEAVSLDIEQIADLKIDATDAELEAAARKLLDVDEGDEDEYEEVVSPWRLDAIMRSTATVVLEWRGDRNHLAVTTLIWVS